MIDRVFNISGYEKTKESKINYNKGSNVFNLTECILNLLVSVFPQLIC